MPTNLLSLNNPFFLTHQCGRSSFQNGPELSGLTGHRVQESWSWGRVRTNNPFNDPEADRVHKQPAIRKSHFPHAKPASSRSSPTPHPCPSCLQYLLPPVARSLMCRAVMPSSLHLWATSWAASMAAYGEDSSLSAFTFIPPVTRQMVSLHRGKVMFRKKCHPVFFPQTGFWVQTEAVISNVTRSINCHTAPRTPLIRRAHRAIQLMYMHHPNSQLSRNSRIVVESLAKLSTFAPKGVGHCREVLCVPYSLARQIGHMDESVIEGGKDVADTKHILSLSNLWSQADDLLFLLLLALTRCHF